MIGLVINIADLRFVAIAEQSIINTFCSILRGISLIRDLADIHIQSREEVDDVTWCLNCLPCRSHFTNVVSYVGNNIQRLSTVNADDIGLFTFNYHV